MNLIDAPRNITELRPRLPIDDLVISLFKECTPRLLVMTDGLNFSNGDFGLSDFVETLKNSVIHGMTPIVETAHRGGSAADHSNFTFTEATLSKSKYDVLFLFGSNSAGSLPPAEVAVIKQFMDDGGGVFATGDHANLGRFLCGDIPRVRGMRRWTGPSASGVDRISTNDPGVDNEFSFNDQSDAIPQKIYPAYTGSTLNSEPHYLLQHPSKKIIEVLPDHPHESECTLPDNLNNTDEWPLDSDDNSVSPEIVALSVSYGGGFPGKQPISAPRSFGAIAAYDGHRAEVGRISTDATWHHFININLVNTGSGPGLVADPDVYDRVSTYFENLARWLMPKKVRRCLRWPLVLTIKELYPVAEFIPELLEQPQDIGKLLEVGRETRQVLQRFFAPGVGRELVEDLFALHSDELSQQIARLRQAPTSLTAIAGQRMTPLEMIEQASLGAWVLTAANAFPSHTDMRANLKKAGGMEGLDKQAQALLRESLVQLAEVFREGRSTLDRVMACCC